MRAVLSAAGKSAAGKELQATTSISPSQGFHFIISTLISANAVQSPVQDRNCAFYILHSFPSDVFLDPYELNQRVQDGITPSFVGIWGETDLELPVAVVDPDRGPSILFGPFPPASSAAMSLSNGLPYKSQIKGGAPEAVEIDFPLHARYPLPGNATAPSSGRTHAVVHIPGPALVHVCERLHEDREGESEPLHPTHFPILPPLYYPLARSNTPKGFPRASCN
jgi:PIG-X / PBN1